MAYSEHTIQLTDGSFTVNFGAPSWGYRTTVYMNISVILLGSGRYATYDYGSSYDYRGCEFNCVLEFDPPGSDARGLLNFVNTFARAKDYSLVLPSGSGFYPFGPDKGDTGTFTVSIQEIYFGSALETPYKYVPVKIKMVSNGSFPAYTIGPHLDEGDLVIGNTANLPFPEAWFNSDTRLRVDTTTGVSGDVSYYDFATNTETLTSNASFQLNTNAAGNLINDITGTLRGGDFTLSVEKSSIPFTPFGNTRSSGTDNYNVKIIEYPIILTHEAKDRFTIPLTFAMN